MTQKTFAKLMDLTADKSTPKYKYAEKLTFDISSNDKFAICIGLNPAAAEQNIDETNKRLIKKLEGKYKGYFLLNLYPEITDNKLQINYEDENNINFIHQLKIFLEKEDNVKLDIILFFGRTTVLSQDQQKLINSLVNNPSPGPNGSVESTIIKSYSSLCFLTKRNPSS